MLPWSDNVLKQPPSLRPKKLDYSDYVPSERCFPFENTQTSMTQREAATAVMDGFIVHHDPSAETGEKVELMPFIEVDRDHVVFRMQRGPIKDKGVNGCQIDDIIKFCADTISVLNRKFPCRENSLAITKLEEAWLWCKGRQFDREARNVEGLDRD